MKQSYTYLIRQYILHTPALPSLHNIFQITDPSASPSSMLPMTHSVMSTQNCRASTQGGKQPASAPIMARRKASSNKSVISSWPLASYSRSLDSITMVSEKHLSCFVFVSTDPNGHWSYSGACHVDLMTMRLSSLEQRYSIPPKSMCSLRHTIW